MRGAAKGTVSAYAHAHLGDVTSDQFRGLASIQRELGAEVRITNRQNFVFRDLTEHQLPTLFERLDAIGMAKPGAELVRDVVACPGADTCNLAVTQTRGLADAIGHRARGRRPRRGRRHAHQHLAAAPTRAASTTSPTSASSAPSAGPTARPPPATRCCSAATSARRRSSSARRPCACRPRPPPRPSVRVVGRFADERTAGETLPGLARPRRRRRRPSAPTLEGARRVPHARREPRLLRRLRRDRALRGRDRRVGVRHMSLTNRAPSRPSSPTPSWPSSARQFETRPASSIIRVGRRQLRAPPGAHRVDDRRGAHRPRGEGRPGHRGRLHRHRLPLPRDARDRRDGPSPLRAEPADHDRAPARTRSCGRSTPRTAARRSRSASSTGPCRQGGVDERPAPGRGRQPGSRRRSWPATCGA